MAEKPATEKTEQPTPRRLKKAKDQGQIAYSEELPATVTIIVLVLIFTFSAPVLMKWFSTQMEEGLSGHVSVFTDNKSFVKYFGEKVIGSMFVLCPIMLAILAGSILACVTVGGLNFSPESVKLKFEELNPVKGFEKLFNIKSLVKLGVSIAKLVVISIVVWFYIRSKIDTLPAMQWSEPEQIVIITAKILLGILIRVCIALLAISAVDVFFQKWKHNQDLMMTKQEVKQDMKDTEGSPEVKVRIRRIQIEMTKKRMLQEVPKANVILVNPTHVAVALRYDPKTMDAPIMVAKGADILAEKIREIATAYGVPIIRRPELARAIYSSVKPGGVIPSNLYIAVAEVLAMIYRLRHKRAN